MTIPLPHDWHLIVAVPGPDGPYFIESVSPYLLDEPDVVEAVCLWEVSGGPSATNIGEPPNSVRTASRNGSTFHIMCFRANSAGKVPVERQITAKIDEVDTAIHVTESIDYEVVMAGKLDVELPGGKVRTLRVGDALVMGGVPHAWKNRYDEDCILAAVTTGFIAPASAS